ncbi:hypothetical protein HY495_03935 [Candidatus Woesearchaeota archaeon]|nr:hypothetical protein [Candidatus Woesearchaeota archaeon]
MYRSLFDDCIDKGIKFEYTCDHRFYRLQNYSNTLDELLQETQEIISGREKADVELAVKRILYPPRIVRALVDWKIKNTRNIPDIEGLIIDAIRVGLGTYRGEDTSPLLCKLRAELSEKDATVLDHEVFQMCDSVTWDSSKPEYSRATSQAIANKTRNDLLFIALGHGGTAVGIDVFLRYCDLVHSEGSLFYTARFSRAKLFDQQPKLGKKERAMLKHWAAGRDIVVFDEDSYSGRTLKLARNYFQRLFPGQEVWIAANFMTYEAKEELRK